MRCRAFLRLSRRSVMNEIQHVVVDYQNVEELLDLLEWCWE